MPRQKKAPEMTFQEHIADFLVREHGYGVLEQSDITDTEHFIAEDQLWAFLTATQADTLTKLTDDYGNGCAGRGIQGSAQGTGAHAVVDAFPPRAEGAWAGVASLLPQAPLLRERLPSVRLLEAGLRAD